MPAAIPLAVAGASVVSGAMGAHAAKSAANTQAASADKALALNTRIYDDQRAQMQPFVTGGQQAFQTLLNGWQSRQGMSPGPQMTATPLAPGRVPNVAGNGGQGVAFGQAMGAPNSGSPGLSSGMVQMQAPDGSVRPVPSQLVDKYRARGAQVVQ
jgi:hypothetical protein